MISLKAKSINNVLIFLTILISYLAAPYSATARLYETKNESAARYGSPVKLRGRIMLPLHKQIPELRYNHHGWLIRSAFINNRTVIISYKKLSRRDMWLKEDEIKAILEAESGKLKWIKINKNEHHTISKKYQNILNGAIQHWKRDDGVIAYVSANVALTFVTPEALKFDIQLQNQKEQKRKKILNSF